MTPNDPTDERNKTGCILPDEEIFASEKVTCVGQVIGLVVGQDQAAAQRAAKLVKVQYQELSPKIITIQVVYFREVLRKLNE